jgi:hypothetical protein
MSINQPGSEHRRSITHDEVPEGAHPTTDQPLNAEPRPQFSPIAIAVLVLTVVVVIIFALTLI